MCGSNPLKQPAQHIPANCLVSDTCTKLPSFSYLVWRAWAKGYLIAVIAWHSHGTWLICLVQCMVPPPSINLVSEHSNLVPASFCAKLLCIPSLSISLQHAVIHDLCPCGIQVMSRGCILEFDTPYALLQDSQSQLRMMVEHTGPIASKKLYQMALEAHQHKKGH